MTFDPQFITIGGIRICLIRKRIKHLYIGVYPPMGEVRASVPWRMENRILVAALEKKLAWIGRKQAQIRARRPLTTAQLQTGERHRLGGETCLLQIIENSGSEGVRVRDGIIELRVRPGSEPARREALFDGWQRDRLRQLILELAERWQPALGVSPVEWRIRRMKTRWGSCNPRARRIWLNLELLKTSVDCLEYVLVHELLHLLEPRHNQHFYALLDRYLPHWRLCRERLRTGL